MREVSSYKMSHIGRPSGNNPTERIKLWEEHFKNFLGQPAFIPEHTEEIETIIPETLPIPTHEFTKEEMTAAIKSTSKGKATGLDNIPAEVWKSGALLDQLLEVCNKAFITGTAG